MKKIQHFNSNSLTLNNNKMLFTTPLVTSTPSVTNNNNINISPITSQLSYFPLRSGSTTTK